MPSSTTTDPKELHKKPPFNEKTQGIPAKESAMREKPNYGEHSYVGRGRLVDRVALITGGDSGIGRAVALAFAREGAHVAISYLSEDEDAAQTAALVEAEGRKALLLRGDLADAEHCAQIVKRTARELGRLDIVVNNAAHQGKALGSLDELDAERIERTFRVNIMALFHIVVEAAKHMKAGGSVINTASIQAYKPSPSLLDYAATKGAVVTFTKALAQELIERGIRVNCVAPGPVWTPIITQSFEGDELRKFGEDSPMKRPAQPAELAPSFVFLASDESSYVNGEVLGVTGGKPLA